MIAVLDTADLEAQAALRQGRVAAAWRRRRRRPLAELKAGSRPQEIDAAKANRAATLVEKNRLETELGRSRRLFERKMISQEEYDRAAAAHGRGRGDRYRQASEQFKLVKAGPRKEAIQQGPGAGRAGGGRAARRRGATGLCRGPLAPGRHRALQEHRAGGIRGPRHARGYGRRHGERLAAGVCRRDGLDAGEIGSAGRGHGRLLPGKVYHGRVSFISQEAEFTPKTVQTEKERVKLVYRIKIDIQNPEMELKAGMPGRRNFKDEGSRMKDAKRPSSFIPYPSSLCP